MRVIVKTHKRVGKNKVSVVKQHGRVKAANKKLKNATQKDAADMAGKTQRDLRANITWTDEHKFKTGRDIDSEGVYLRKAKEKKAAQALNKRTNNANKLLGSMGIAASKGLSSGGSANTGYTGGSSFSGYGGDYTAGYTGGYRPQSGY